jgi:hypothetical protein
MYKVFEIILRLLLIPLVKSLIVSFTEKKRRADELEAAKKYQESGDINDANKLQ